MVATLLGRSQDLTAVILAIEQLTGAVAANQVSLTGTTSADASANLVANEQALVNAQEKVTKREAAEEEATTKREEANTALGTANTNKEAADATLRAAKAKNPQDAGEITTADSKHKRAQESRQKAEEELKRAEADLKTKKDQLENAKASRRDNPGGHGRCPHKRGREHFRLRPVQYRTAEEAVE